MNFKALGFGLLATVATIVGGVAEAGYVVKGVHLMDSNDFGRHNANLSQSMITSLNEMGIPVIDGGKQKIDICVPDPNSGSYTLGYYVPADNYIVICTNVSNKDQQFETLTHEIVHVIQDARKGLDNDKMGDGATSQIIKKMTQAKYDDVRELYPSEHWALEFEAFHYQDQPVAVATELAKWAF